MATDSPASAPRVRLTRHLVLCGGARPSSRSKAWQSAPTLRLCLGPGRHDVHLRLEHLTRAMCADAPDVGADLLELAAYVYAADQAVSRGRPDRFEYGARWRRHFRFEVPVRRPDIWASAEVREPLARVLGFLSDDDYEFSFSRLRDAPRLEPYLFGGPGAGGLHDIEEVVLFSGGLDSLGGAVREILQLGRRVALVSHRPAPQTYTRQCRLAAELAQRVTHPGLRPLHVAVEVNKGERLTREFTQRTRSFLFAAVAAVVARLAGRSKVRFYENGVVSLNLPYSPQVLGGRASRTTHPQVLQGFAGILGRLFETPFVVDNPFLWSTKAKVLSDLRAAGLGELCAMTSSCVHTRAQTPAHGHCGRCSQCVDRRLSALAADLGDAEDPPGDYAADVLTGPLNGAEALLAERYVGMLLEIGNLADALAFQTRFPEVARALRFVDGSTAQAAVAAHRLYREHAAGVLRALTGAVAGAADGIVRRVVPPNCLLAIGGGFGVGGRTPAADGVAASSTSAACGLVVDNSRFEARLGGACCFLGNTVEYRLLARLHRSPGAFVSVTELGEDVWDDAEVCRNTIQRAVYGLRRKLREEGFTGLDIDGKQPGHYRLLSTS